VSSKEELLVKRKAWAVDGAKAWDEYLAAPDIAAAKTARLRQQRLQKEAHEKDASSKALSEAAQRLKKSLAAKKSAPKAATRRKTQLVPRTP
jgi:hypothetical protein